MKKKDAESINGTLDMLKKLAYSVHGVMDIIDYNNLWHRRLSRRIAAISRDTRECQTLIIVYSKMDNIKSCKRRCKRWQLGWNWASFMDAKMRKN